MCSLKIAVHAKDKRSGSQKLSNDLKESNFGSMPFPSYMYTQNTSSSDDFEVQASSAAPDSSSDVSSVAAVAMSCYQIDCSHSQAFFGGVIFAQFLYTVLVTNTGTFSPGVCEVELFLKRRPRVASGHSAQSTRQSLDLLGARRVYRTLRETNYVFRDWCNRDKVTHWKKAWWFVASRASVRHGLISGEYERRGMMRSTVDE